MKTLFITATGTDIGKTYVTAQLLRHLRADGIPVRALKPVMSGFDPARPEASDAGQLLAALGEPVTGEALDRISPLRFAAPLAPNMAARAEGRRLMLADLMAATATGLAAGPGPVVIEGVGGVMSPVAEDATGLDWLVALGCPAVLVAGSYLGTISHILTAVAALEARRVPLLAVVVNETAGSSVQLDATCAEVARFLPVAPILSIRLNMDRSAQVFERIAALLGLEKSPAAC